MKKAFIWSFGILLTLIFMVGAYFFSSRTLPSKPKGFGLGDYTPLASVEFDDLSIVKILKLEVGQLVDKKAKRKSFLSSSSSSTNSYSSGIQIRREEINSQLVSRTYSHDSSSSRLYLLLKTAANFPEDEPFFRGGRLSNDINHPIPPPSELYALSSEEELPSLTVQLRASNGDWYTAEGPFFDPEKNDGLGVVCFQAWERSQATLEFRLLTPDDTQSITIKNPFAISAPIPLTAKPLPQKHSEPDFTFELHNARLLPLAEQGELLLVEKTFSPNKAIKRDKAKT